MNVTVSNPIFIQVYLRTIVHSKRATVLQVPEDRSIADNGHVVIVKSYQVVCGRPITVSCRVVKSVIIICAFAHPASCTEI